MRNVFVIEDCIMPYAEIRSALTEVAKIQIKIILINCVPVNIPVREGIPASLYSSPCPAINSQK